MIILIKIVLLGLTTSYGGTNDIHTVGQAVCIKSNIEHRISLRSFGDKPVPCDLIYKQSEDKFKKLKLIVDSKKDFAVCKDQFEKHQKSLQDKGFVCTVSLDPRGMSKKQNPKIVDKIAEKPPEKPTEKLPPAQAVNPPSLQAPPPVATPKLPSEPPAAPVKKSVPTNIQTPPPPPSDWVPPKK